MDCKWINIHDRAPEEGQQVLGYFDVFDSIEIYTYHDVSKEFEGLHHQFINRTGFLTDDITHWMPLPKKPAKTPEDDILQEMEKFEEDLMKELTTDQAFEEAEHGDNVQKFESMDDLESSLRNDEGEILREAKQGSPGEILQGAMLRDGIMVVDLADALDMTPNDIEKMILNKKPIPEDIAEDLAKMFRTVKEVFL